MTSSALKRHHFIYK